MLQIKEVEEYYEFLLMSNMILFHIFYKSKLVNRKLSWGLKLQTPI